MMYTYDIYKLKTLPDAQLDQEAKYPSSDAFPLKMQMVLTGEVTVGDVVTFLESKRFRGFRTSKVVEIVEETDEFTIFRTLNSIYKIVKVQEI